MSCFPGSAPGSFTAGFTQTRIAVLWTVCRRLPVSRRPLIPTDFWLVATNNECSAWGIKGLARGGGTVTSLHGRLFPSHDRGNSRLAPLQDLGGKICRPTTTANSTLGECSRWCFCPKGPFALKRFPQRTLLQRGVSRRGQGPAARLLVPHRGGGGKRLSEARGPAGLEQL